MSLDKDPVPTSETTDIAIIGMSCRLPGASTVDEFWARILEGNELLTALTRDELLAAGVDPVLLDHPQFMPVTSLVENAEDFEAEFFGIPNSEARLMDPQHRLFLELSWQALESAGHDPDRFTGDIGVFGGAGRHAYLRNVEPHFEPMDYLDGSIHGLQADIGNYGDFLATRVSYRLNLTGPSITIASACSTALVAVHLACQSLYLGESDLALAGAVNLHNPQCGGYYFEEGSICSADGHLRAFDAGANGSVFGNGGGVVALRRLQDAVADGDRVVAVIKGSAVNNDGADKMTFAAPGVQGQAKVITRAHRMAGVRPQDVGYVEAHGTGTPVGDPIEVAALIAAFGSTKSPGTPCALGTVKSQIGHLGPAAGMAGLIKAALVVQRGMIPAAVNIKEVNPRIGLENSPFQLPSAARTWPEPRVAGVSAFGVGGTNAHLVLASGAGNTAAVAQERPEPEARPALDLPFVVSARTPQALEAACSTLGSYLHSHPTVRAADVAHVLATGRRHLKHRVAVVAASTAEAARALCRGPQLQREDASGSGLPVVFAFPGQGGHFAGAGRALYEREPVYRTAVDECAVLLREMNGMDLLSTLLPPPTDYAAAIDRIAEAIWAQPATFTLEYALGRTLLAKGITPDILIGHSVGEYAAACLAGVFSLRDAMNLVAARGRLMQQMSTGAMTAIGLSEDDVRQFLPDTLDIAALNAPNQTVVSGSTAEIDTLEAKLTAAGILNTRVGTRHAAHSRLVDPMMAEFASTVASVRLRPARMRMVSTLTGGWADGAVFADPDYWIRHLRLPVRFTNAASAILAEGTPFVIECGPGRALNRMFGAAAPSGAVPGYTPWVKDFPAPSSGAALVGQLWALGMAPEWSRTIEGPARRVELPGYPFERRGHWIDPPVGQPVVAAPVPAPRSRPRVHWLQETRWVPAPPPSADLTGKSRRLLLLAEKGHEELATALRVTGHDVMHVDYGGADVLNHLSAEELTADTLVYVAPVPLAAGEPLGLRADRLLTFGFRLLLDAVTGMLVRRGSDELDVVVVTRGRHATDPDDTVRPELALLDGPCRVLPQEYPSIRLAQVDVAADDADEMLAVAVHDELAMFEAGEVIHRSGGTRYRRTYVPTPGGPAEWPWAQAGTYLITGGLGGIGLAVAQAAARTPEVRLVLTHRTPLPPEAEWVGPGDNHPAADPLRHRIETLRRLRADGVDVVAVESDVSDPAAAATLASQYGPFDGIIHAAGVPGGRLIAMLDDKHVAEVMAPKVTGAIMVDDILATERTDWVLLCSSMSSVVGGLGHADYASANAFLDAFAQWRNARGRRTVSLAFDVWTDFGMAVNEAARGSRHGGALPGVPAQSALLDHPLFDERRVSPGLTEYVGQLDPRADWVVAEHRIAGEPVLPGTGILEYLRAAADLRLGSSSGVDLVEVDLVRPVVLAADQVTRIIVAVQEDPDGLSVRLSTRHAGGPRVLHATAGIRAGASVPSIPNIPIAEYADVGEEAGVLTLAASDVLTLGPRWACTAHGVRVTDNQVTGEYRLPGAFIGDLDRFVLHPALLDVAAGAFVPLASAGAYLPLSYERVSVRAPMTSAVHSVVALRSAPDAETLRVDVQITDGQGTRLADIVGYCLRRVATEDAGRVTALRSTVNRGLVTRDVGDLEALCFVGGQLESPSPGEVQIRVLATGLNFKEVLLASGMLPADEEYRFGLECAGIVHSIGPGVTRFAPGDPVMAVGASCFSDLVNCDAHMVHPIPPGLSFSQAASVPIAFATAYDALVTVGHLRAGERVLVQAAAGGVGLAALQVARHCGAQVFGTAGNVTKREFVLAAGAVAVSDSRSLDFEREVAAAGGVDVVLNSLAGDFIPAGLRTLRPGGRFVEIGRRDIVAGTALDLGLFAQGCTFAAYNPEMSSGSFAEAWKQVAELLSAGVLTCLPVRTFDTDEVTEAFTFMARAHHIGKVVVTRPGANAVVAEVDASPPDGRNEPPPGITARTGLAAMQSALASGRPALLVSRRRVVPSSDQLFVATHVLDPVADLVAPAAPAAGADLAGFRSATERALGEIWANLLQVPAVTPEHRFVDLGGDSLYATQMVARIRRDFGVRVAPADVLGDLPLRALAARIDELADGGA